MAATVVLAVFILLTGLALEQAFEDSARSARAERLLGQLYLLMAAAEVDDAGRLALPAELSESRFSLPGSGLYARVSDARGATVWQSPSSLGHPGIPHRPQLSPGEKDFAELHDARGVPYFVYSFGIDWQAGRVHRRFTFSVAEDLAAFEAQLDTYRHSLWGWLGAMALLLLTAQAVLLAWGLRPLREVAREVTEIESGRRERIEGRYPSEIQGLADGMNGLIVHERARQRRYRDALADLAHSLKTPLAVMRSSVGEPPDQVAATVEAEVTRMDRIVDYQLRRAATEGGSGRFAAALAVAPRAERLIASLAKVYREKGVEPILQAEANARFRGDEGDLMELLGNLIDNSYKWCRHRVRVSARSTARGLTLAVEDDGPGFPEGEAERVLSRGVRADEAVPGHGIGLAVVRDIVQAYGGELALARSDLGGASVTLYLPGA